MTTNSGFYLGIGRVLTESVTSKIQTTGGHYVVKLLQSNPPNWIEIAAIVAQSDFTGAVVKLTAQDFKRIARADYAAAADVLFGALSKKPYVLLVHEEVVTPSDLGLEAPSPVAVDPDDDENWYDDTDYEDWNDEIARNHFGTLPKEVREAVQRRLDAHSLTVTTYKRNAEASILAAAFVDDTMNNLLFRIYVPAGRLFEDELARVLELFHDWLGSVKAQTVRQAGYRTPSGRVIEFFGEPGMSADIVRDDLQEFATFLTIVEDAEGAEQMLKDLGLASTRASELVSKYAKAARRVLVDTKQARERLILDVQQQLESELVDELQDISTAQLGELVAQLVPESPFAASSATRSLAKGHSAGAASVVNVQIIERVEGVVAQNINGSVAVGAPLAEFIDLIRQLGGGDADDLEAKARELADTKAPLPARLHARQALKNFLFRNIGRVEATMYASASAWVGASISQWLK